MAPWMGTHGHLFEFSEVENLADALTAVVTSVTCGIKNAMNDESKHIKTLFAKETPEQ